MAAIFEGENKLKFIQLTEHMALLRHGFVWPIYLHASGVI